MESLKKEISESIFEDVLNDCINKVNGDNYEQLQ